jgi:hypothetical protein
VSRKWRFIIVICISQVLVLALWFSTTAVVPSLQKERTLTAFHVSLLTSSVQVGFVIGTFVSAFLGLADRLDLRRFFSAAAASAAAANILILTLDRLHWEFRLCASSSAFAWREFIQSV